MKIYTRSLCLILALLTVVAGLGSHRTLFAAPLDTQPLTDWLPTLPSLAHRDAAIATSSGPLDVQARVTARSKMSTRLASYAAAGDERLMRLQVLLADDAVTLDSSRVAALGGRVLRADGEATGPVVDLPGQSLDRFALDGNVQRVSLVGIVAKRQDPTL